MSKSQISGVVVALIFIVGTGLYIRSSETGFYAYLKKDYVGAEAGLKARVAAGDGFAAFILGENRFRGHLPDARPEQAFNWYKQGILLGDLNSAAGYLYATMLTALPGSKGCEIAEKTLIEGAGVGHLLVTSRSAEIFRSGGCVERDLVRAGYYFELSRLIDPRMGTLADDVRAMLTQVEIHRLEEQLKSSPPPISPANFLSKVRAAVNEIERAK